MEGRDSVLVTGITGQQGGAVAQSLSDRGVPVIGFTRNARKAAEWKRRSGKGSHGGGFL
jgi:uncharacterized protein YbjT (DUF2867 family)